MKRHPIQNALVRFAYGKQTQKDIALAADVLRSCAEHLAEEARTNCPNVEHSHALKAGAMALASLAAELRAGGVTDASADYLDRALQSSVAHGFAKHGMDLTGFDEDDDDERMERHEEESRQPFDDEDKTK